MDEIIFDPELRTFSRRRRDASVLFTQTAHTTCMQLSSISAVPPPPQQEHCARDLDRGRQKSKEGRRCCLVADILRLFEEEASSEFLFRATVPEARSKHSFRGHRCDGEAVTAVRKLCVYPRRPRGNGVCKKKQHKTKYRPKIKLLLVITIL